MNADNLNPTNGEPVEPDGDSTQVIGGPEPADATAQVPVTGMQQTAPVPPVPVPPVPPAPMTANPAGAPAPRSGDRRKRGLWIAGAAVVGVLLLGGGFGLGAALSDGADDDYIVHVREDDHDRSDRRSNSDDWTDDDRNQSQPDANATDPTPGATDSAAGSSTPTDPAATETDTPALAEGSIEMSDDIELTGDVLTKAASAAIAAAGGSGVVTDAELSDSQSHVYEVEVRLDSGKDVNVDLDENFAVVRVH
jgi:uncharacterized membrane protein YkoI